MEHGAASGAAGVQAPAGPGAWRRCRGRQGRRRRWSAPRAGARRCFSAPGARAPPHPAAGRGSSGELGGRNLAACRGLPAQETGLGPLPEGSRCAGFCLAFLSEPVPGARVFENGFCCTSGPCLLGATAESLASHCGYPEWERAQKPVDLLAGSKRCVGESVGRCGETQPSVSAFE